MRYICYAISAYSYVYTTRILPLLLLHYLSLFKKKSWICFSHELCYTSDIFGRNSRLLLSSVHLNISLLKSLLSNNWRAYNQAIFFRTISTVNMLKVVFIGWTVTQRQCENMDVKKIAAAKEKKNEKTESVGRSVDRN